MRALVQGRHAGCNIIGCLMTMFGLTWFARTRNRTAYLFASGTVVAQSFASWPLNVFQSVTRSCRMDRGPKRTKPDHSSPADAVSIGPGALNRRTGAIRSSVRSHPVVGSQPGVFRRHHCRPPALFRHVWHALRGQSGRMRSLGAARQRLWPAWKAPKRRCRAKQRPRDGVLSRADALWSPDLTESCVVQQPSVSQQQRLQAEPQAI